MIQKIEQPLLQDQTADKAVNESPSRPVKPRQWRLWLFSFGALAFGLICIALLPERSLPRPDPKGLAASAEQPNQPEGSLVAVTPTTGPKTVNTRVVETKVIETLADPAKSENSPIAAAPAAVAPIAPIAATPLQIAPAVNSSSVPQSHATKAVPVRQNQVKLKKPTEQKIAGKKLDSVQARTIQSASAGVQDSLNGKSTYAANSSSSGMPSQSVHSMPISNPADHCQGTIGLAREQCQQCDARQGWLFKLNCEAQVKTRFCSGREGKHVECPPSYHTPG